MKRRISITLLASLLLTFLLFSCVEQPDLRNLSPATPEAVGMSSERLDRLKQHMQKEVDEGNTPGITSMIARHGKIVHFETYGYRDLENKVPIEKNTIFRIYSMTKPVTGVALMMLYEEGKFRLSDPVSKYIPEFKDLKVVVDPWQKGPDIDLEDVNHEMTIRELMSHTAGFTYGLFSYYNVDYMYQAANLLDYHSTLKEMIRSLSEIPLLYQPGEHFHYSIAVDVQGYLVEVLSGMSFRDFLMEKVITPLKMVDTDFYVPEEKHDRFAHIYMREKGGELVSNDNSMSLNTNVFYNPVTFFSGGAGLVSTTMDYMRFCQMLLNGGELDGVRLLAPGTVDLMRRNHLPEDVKGAGERDFGLDFAIVKDGKNGESIGEYSWGGAAGTWFWIDPLEDLVFVGMRQQFGQRPDLEKRSRPLVYQAIIESKQ
jgi:CubicO group peptidase (beta-lactamase class C family)